MKIKSKALLAALCAALLVAGSVFGTLAYLTFETDQVKNTFTVGDVFPVDPENPDLEPFVLLEHEWEDTDDDGIANAKVQEEKTEGETTTKEDKEITEGSYTALPGVTLPKDPFVRSNVEFSIDAYIFVEVIDGTEGQVTYAVSDDWELLANVEGEHEGDVYALKNMLEGGTALAQTYILAGNTDYENGVVTIADDVEPGTKLGTLEFYAYAVQASTFETAAAAWDAAYGDSGSSSDDEDDEVTTIGFYEDDELKYMVKTSSVRTYGDIKLYGIYDSTGNTAVKIGEGEGKNLIVQDNGYGVYVDVNGNLYYNTSESGSDDGIKSDFETLDGMRVTPCPFTVES